MDKVDVIHQDFKIFNTWKEDSSFSYYNGRSMYIIDSSTGRKYLNEDQGVVGFKCFLLSLGTVPVHIIASVFKVSYHAFKAVACFFDIRNESSYNLKARLSDCAHNLKAIAMTPAVIALLELSALYGIFSPYNGRKLYASLERAHYGHFILAPCFQPAPASHLFGGDLRVQNAF
jgi:hypothetical protein